MMNVRTDSQQGSPLTTLQSPYLGRCWSVNETWCWPRLSLISGDTVWDWSSVSRERQMYQLQWTVDVKNFVPVDPILVQLKHGYKYIWTHNEPPIFPSIKWYKSSHLGLFYKIIFDSVNRWPQGKRKIFILSKWWKTVETITSSSYE